MPHYIYSDSLLTAVHRAMWTALSFTLDIGGGRGNACDREEVLMNALQKRRLTNAFEFCLVLSEAYNTFVFGIIYYLTRVIFIVLCCSALLICDAIFSIDFFKSKTICDINMHLVFTAPSFV